MVAAGRASYEHLKITPDWSTFREYFARLERQGMGINLASYVGATSVRRMVLGDADVQPTTVQLAEMQALVRQAMQDGAVGLSSALQYAPARRVQALQRQPVVLFQCSRHLHLRRDTWPVGGEHNV